MRDNESVEMLIFGSQRFYLEPTQLERLKAHKYSAQGTSLLEPLMQPFWKWLVTKIPLWLAPNLITFIGLLINIFTTIPVLLLDQNAEGLAPSWSYITCAVGFFLYQSLDAIDGKQARRTGTNNPLGELFDHGCDAISVFLVVTSAISSVALHDNTLVMLGFIVLLMMLTFFYHWQTYVCGVLHFKLIDVTEAQFLHISLLLIAGLLGPDFWLNNVPFTDISLKLVLIVCVYATSLLNSIVALRIILTAGVGKNGSTVADTSVLSPSIILFFQVPVVFLYILYSPGPLNNNCMLFFSAMALPLVKSIIYLMIGSMTKSPLPLFDSIMLGPLLAFANVYLGTLLSEYYVLLVVLVYNIADITLMCILLCRQICICLDIHCFTIPSNPPKS